MDTEPPPVASRVFLKRALAFERQARRSGGLSKRDRRQLCTLAGLSTAHPASKPPKKSSNVHHKKTVKLVPGTRLLREWNGKTYQVSVIEDGFVYRDKVWNSLSAIAKDITGAHWSGPRFFGAVRRTVSDGHAP